MKLTRSAQKVLEVVFPAAMFSLFGLQCYYCCQKILDPVVIKSSVQKLQNHSRFPRITLCRKGITIQNESFEIPHEILGRFCKDNITCIQKLLFKRQDIIGESFYNINYLLAPLDFNVSYNIYTVYPYYSLNCLEVNHPIDVHTGKCFRLDLYKYVLHCTNGWFM